MDSDVDYSDLEAPLVAAVTYMAVNVMDCSEDRPIDFWEEKVLNKGFPEKVAKLKAIMFEECDEYWQNGGFSKFVNPIAK